MRLSLSARIAEKYFAKREPAIDLDAFLEVARSGGYSAICMRASQIGLATPAEVRHERIARLGASGLAVSMCTADFAIPENSDEGPLALRNITPYLDLAQAMGARVIRVAIRKDEDIPWVRRACDEAAERSLVLAHQCHNKSLFETVESCIETTRLINRNNFGLTYEPANLELCGDPYGRGAIQRLAPLIVNVYLQNQRIHPAGKSQMITWSRGTVCFDQLPIWEAGGIDFAEVVGALKEIGYGGFVTVHQAMLGDPAEDARRTADFLRELYPFE